MSHAFPMYIHGFQFLREILKLLNLFESTPCTVSTFKLTLCASLTADSSSRGRSFMLKFLSLLCAVWWTILFRRVSCKPAAVGSLQTPTRLVLLPAPLILFHCAQGARFSCSNPPNRRKCFPSPRGGLAPTAVTQSSENSAKH